MEVSRAPGELFVMSFNVRGAHRRDGENTWRRRAHLNADVILRCAPDLIGFQELQAGNARFYEQNLPGYEGLLGRRYENRRPHAFNAIYWRPERLELLDRGGFWLSETPERFSRSWGARQARSANWARFRLLSAGAQFVHLNTHLDHGSAEARRQGSRLILKRIAGIAGDLPVLVTGDFNADPAFPVHHLFTGAGFGDVHTLAGNPPARTFHRFRGERFSPRRPDREWRIDWVLVRDGARDGWNVHSCEVIRDAEPPLYPSDHYPVLAVLSLESAAR